MIPKPVAPQVTRRAFVQAGGALFVSLVFPRTSLGADAPPTQRKIAVASWLEVRSDQTILIRTGRSEIGTGMSAFFPQVVAEELRVRPETIKMVMGDTDKTSDGGYPAGFMT